MADGGTLPMYPAWMPQARAAEWRFWGLVSKGPECWLWQRGTDKDGYGFFCITTGPRKQRAPRVAYLLANGPIPSGLLILHSCDNPRCCRPDHLSVGTQLQNRAEAKLRGRVAKGPTHGCAKLTEEQAREVIRLRGEGLTGKAIAARFGIGVSTAQQIGKNIWRHLG